MKGNKLQPNHLAQKLAFGAALDALDVERLRRLTDHPISISAGTDLRTEGESPRSVHFIAAGTACRYKHLSDGRRAIVALLLPGDFCDLHVDLLGRMDHSLGALTECTFSRIGPIEIDELLLSHPAIRRACRWADLVDVAVLREWLVNVGRRSSEQHLAHLLCELYLRLKAVGLTRDKRFPMPFTQVTLGDLLGITPVHVQRIMGRLRESGLITLQDREVHLVDFEALAERGEFDPSYLHLGGPHGQDVPDRP